MSNLLNTLKELATNQLVSSLAKNCDANEGRVSVALNMALPTLLQSICTAPFTKHDIISEMLHKSVKQENFVTTLIDALDKRESSAPAQIGAGLVDLILGNHTRSLSNHLSHSSGLPPEACSHIFQISGSLVAYFLGKKMTDEQLSFQHLLATLQERQHEFKEAIPEHIYSVLQPITSNETQDLKKMPQQGKSAPIKTDDRGNRWMLPLVLMALLGIGVWYWIKGYYIESEVTINITNPIYDSAGRPITDKAETLKDSSEYNGPALKNNETNTEGMIDKDGNWIAPKGDPIKLKLTNGIELDATKNSLEDKLYNFIQDPSARSSNTIWFDFNDLLFESGKHTLKATETKQLKNVCEILKAYPKVRIKLGGYTDNTGDSVKNVTLSTSRVRTVYNLMLKEGVPKQSFTEEKPFEGFGPQFPVGDNNTETGRAQNRRIALSVREK
jgi:OOP family OmpA-OmpF porin